MGKCGQIYIYLLSLLQIRVANIQQRLSLHSPFLHRVDTRTVQTYPNTTGGLNLNSSKIPTTA